MDPKGIRSEADTGIERWPSGESKVLLCWDPTASLGYCLGFRIDGSAVEGRLDTGPDSYSATCTCAVNSLHNLSLSSGWCVDALDKMKEALWRMSDPGLPLSGLCCHYRRDTVRTFPVASDRNII